MDAARTSASLDNLLKLPARYPARTLQLAGEQWRVRDTGGGGAALVLLPGSLGNADIFYNQVLAIAPRHRCLAVDYPEAPGTVVADGLASLLDELRLNHVHLLGSSLAGYWLQTFGVRYPARVATMILANTFCDAEDLRQHPLFSVTMLSNVPGETLKAEWLDRLEARAQDELRDVQKVLLRDGQTGESLRKRLLAAATASLAPTMPGGQFPIGIIDCADDPILTVRTREVIASRYPAAQRLTLPIGGHYPYVTQAHTYTRFVERIMAS